MPPQSRFVPKGPVYRDAADKVLQESRNGVVQIQYVLFRVSEWNADSHVTPDLVAKLQELAVNQNLSVCRIFSRRSSIPRGEGIHQPPPYQEVSGLVDEMCSYVNDNWKDSTAGHLSAYLMWRMNWVHPFFGGNGRTARAISYLVLCAKLGFRLPGKKTIPEMIAEDRTRYYSALRSADAAWSKKVLDISEMENLLSDLLAEQLVQIHEQATGKNLH